jgi:hypothetical protein
VCDGGLQQSAIPKCVADPPLALGKITLLAVAWLRRHTGAG